MSETERQDAEQRVEQRFALNSNTQLPVRVARGDGGPEELGTGIDISFSGAKIKLNSPVAPKSEIDVAINGEADPRRAQVCWSRPAPGGAWWVGCRFDEKLPLEVIDSLATSGFLDRRQDNRRLMSVEGTARYELNTEIYSVKLVNMSRGGFSLLAPAPPGKSKLLMLTVPGESSRTTVVPAKIAWTTPAQDGYQLGCQFTTQQGYQQLHQALVRPERSILKSWRPTPDRSHTAILVAVLVMAWALWLLLPHAWFH